MTFRKGHKKYGGRLPGTPNALTVLKRAGIAEVASELEKHGIDLIARLAAIVPELEPKDAATVYVALLPYRYPKLKPEDRKPENPFANLTRDEKARVLREMLTRIEAEDAEVVKGTDEPKR